MYFSPIYINPRQNIVILFWKYLVGIGRQAWLNPFWEIIGNLFAELARVGKITLSSFMPITVEMLTLVRQLQSFLRKANT
jgi:hypothetical protein